MNIKEINNSEYQRQKLSTEFEDFFNPNTMIPDIFKDECIIDDFSSASKLDVTEEIKMNFMEQSKAEKSFNNIFLSPPESSLSLESNESIFKTLNFKEYFMKDEPNNTTVVSQFNLLLPEATNSNSEDKFILADKNKDNQSQGVSDIKKKETEAEKLSVKKQPKSVLKTRFSKKDDKGKAIEYYLFQ